MLQELEIAKRAEERLKAAEKQRNAKLLALEAEVEQTRDIALDVYTHFEDAGLPPSPAPAHVTS